MATNEYGQASTSAFFKVLKVSPLFSRSIRFTLRVKFCVVFDTSGPFYESPSNNWPLLNKYFNICKVQVEKEAAPPAFVGKLADQTCTEGEVIAFECEVGSFYLSLTSCAIDFLILHCVECS